MKTMLTYLLAATGIFSGSIAAALLVTLALLLVALFIALLALPLAFVLLVSALASPVTAWAVVKLNRMKEGKTS